MVLVLMIVIVMVMVIVSLGPSRGVRLKGQVRMAVAFWVLVLAMLWRILVWFVDNSPSALKELQLEVM